ncbi:MAG: hypothetical protein DME21_04805 [Verrucomicrobia bacterium]|nr:MAG: hypothetical protein DME21_04805 [Verrucomicrobiota bacterium]
MTLMMRSTNTRSQWYSEHQHLHCMWQLAAPCPLAMVRFASRTGIEISFSNRIVTLALLQF